MARQMVISCSFCVDGTWYAIASDLMPRGTGRTNAQILEDFRAERYVFKRKAGEIVLIDHPDFPDLKLVVGRDI